MTKYIIAFAAVILLGIPLIKVAFFPAHVVNKTIDMSYGVVDKTLTADNAIYNYEWFKNKAAEINSAEESVTATDSIIASYKSSLPKERKDWTFEDKQEDSRLNSIRIGQTNYLIGLKNDYNAKAKMANRSIFKDVPASFGF